MLTKSSSLPFESDMSNAVSIRSTYLNPSVKSSVPSKTQFLRSLLTSAWPSCDLYWWVHRHTKARCTFFAKFSPLSTPYGNGTCRYHECFHRLITHKRNNAFGPAIISICLGTVFCSFDLKYRLHRLFVCLLFLRFCVTSVLLDTELKLCPRVYKGTASMDSSSFS